MKTSTIAATAFTFFAVMIFAVAVSAQATRTWVSGVGDDVNPCSRTAPCKTFAGAISKTATNGEISCLDPGGFGSVTITKSITIDCEDTQGSILASSVNGIVINITLAADTRKSVRLRGLTINGANTGLNGVRILAANAVSINDTVIDGFNTHGVSVETTSGTPKIILDQVTIRNTVGNGVNTFITGGAVQLAINKSVISNTATAVNLSSNTKAVVKDSLIASNTTGLLAASAELNASNCVVSNNTTGISSLAGGVIRLYANIITNNTTGLSSGGGSILSSNNNQVDGNLTNGVVTGFISNT